MNLRVKSSCNLQALLDRWGSSAQNHTTPGSWWPKNLHGPKDQKPPQATKTTPKSSQGPEAQTSPSGQISTLVVPRTPKRATNCPPGSPAPSGVKLSHSMMRMRMMHIMKSHYQHVAPMHSSIEDLQFGEGKAVYSLSLSLFTQSCKLLLTLWKTMVAATFLDEPRRALPQPRPRTWSRPSRRGIRPCLLTP